MILPRLQSLATMWLSHLLFVCMCPYPGHGTYLDKGTKQGREDLIRTNVYLYSHFFFHYFHFNDKQSR